MSREKELETMLTISTGLLVLYFIFDLPALLYVMLGVGLIGLFVSPICSLISTGWYKLAEAMGFVSSKVLLTLIYYLFLLPIALLSRLFRREKFLRGKEEISCYKTRNHRYQPADLENMW